MRSSFSVRGSLGLLLGASCLLGHAACSSTDTSAYSDGDRTSEYGPDAGSYNGSERSDAGSSVPGNPGDKSGTRMVPRPDAGLLDPDAATPTCAGIDPSVPDVLYLSSDDSNSMASPAIARRIISRHQGVVPALILRTYEFLNYYNVPYTPADQGALRIVPQMRHAATATDVELQIGVQSAPALTPRAPITLTLVLDTSGSMGGTPIATLSRAIKAIAAQLHSGDIVNAVTWDTVQRVRLEGHSVTGPNDPALIALANGLSASGGTDLSGGLAKGYDLAEQYRGTGRINRLAIISDGQANVGITDAKLIGVKANVNDKDGIYLVGIGVGDGVNDTLMDVVTDAGNGAYVYLDSFDEADKILGGRFDEVMGVAARDVQVKVTLPWYFKMLEFHGEEYSTDPAKVKPQDLAPGDSMVFHQLLRACDAAQIQNADSIEVEATWKDPITFAPLSTKTTQTMATLFTGADAELRRGRAIVAYAEALKAVAKSTVPASGRRALLDKAILAVDQADPGNTDPDLKEIRALLVTYEQDVATP